MKIRTNKKGISVWISWVLLVVFIVLLSAFMYGWMTNYTRQTTEDVKKVVYNEEECNYISLDIDACSTDSLILINFSNRGTLRIDKILLRLHSQQNVTNIELNMTKDNKTLKPERTRTESINDTGNIYIIDAIPIYIKGEYKIVCTNKLSTQTNITKC